MKTVIDNSRAGLDRVWFEGGDHRTLISVAGADFDRLMTAWPGLPGHIKAAVLALVDSVNHRECEDRLLPIIGHCHHR